MAISYSGFREGQYPDRGEGAVNPSAAEILEDLQILAAHGFRLIRLYDAGELRDGVLLGWHGQSQTTTAWKRLDYF